MSGGGGPRRRAARAARLRPCRPRPFPRPSAPRTGRTPPRAPRGRRSGRRRTGPSPCRGQPRVRRRWSSPSESRSSPDRPAVRRRGRPSSAAARRPSTRAGSGPSTTRPSSSWCPGRSPSGSSCRRSRERSRSTWPKPDHSSRATAGSSRRPRASGRSSHHARGAGRARSRLPAPRTGPELRGSHLAPIVPSSTRTAARSCSSSPCATFTGSWSTTTSGSRVRFSR